MVRTCLHLSASPLSRPRTLHSSLMTTSPPIGGSPTGHLGYHGGESDPRKYPPGACSRKAFSRGAGAERFWHYRVHGSLPAPRRDPYLYLQCLRARCPAGRAAGCPPQGCIRSNDRSYNPAGETRLCILPETMKRLRLRSLKIVRKQSLPEYTSEMPADMLIIFP